MEPAGAERHRRSPEGELAGASESIEPARRMKASLSNETERNIEAGAGIEPANSGFADRDLTTWLPRRLARADNIVVAAVVSTRESFRSQAPSIETQCSPRRPPLPPVNALTLQRIRLSLVRDKVVRTICSRTETNPRRRKFAGARVA